MPRSIPTKSSLAATLVAAMTVLPLTWGLVTLTHPALAQERILKTLTVSGRGVEKIPTTLTRITLGVMVQGDTAEAAQQEAARRSSAVVTFLKAQNVAKLETSSITLNALYTTEGNRQKITGYQATNTVSFQIATEQAGAILDNAIKSGATRIDGLSFIATDEAIAAAQKMALRKATQDAQQQASVVLSSLNLTQREIIGVQVNGVSAPPPEALQVSDGYFAKAASTPVLGREMAIEATITLQISY